MGHNTLNQSISVPDLPRKPHVWQIPNADMLYDDHLIDPLRTEMLREDWLSDETDSNPLTSGEKDIEDTRYGTKLGSLAVGTNDLERAEESAGDNSDAGSGETNNEEKE